MEESIEFQFEKYPMTLSTVEHYIKEWTRALRSIKFKKINTVKILTGPPNYQLLVWAMTDGGGMNTIERMVEKHKTLMKDHLKNLRKLRAHLRGRPNLVW